MIENLIISGVFFSAVGYVGNLIYKSFKPNTKAGCAKGCGTCSVVSDFEKKKVEMF